MKEELKNTIKKLKSIQIAEAQQNELIKTKKDYQTELNDLSKQINRKLKNINTLSKLSFYSIYERLIGDINSALEMSKSHYLELSLKYKELQKSIQTIDFELEILEEKILKYESTKKTLKKLILERNENVESTRLREYKIIILETDSKLRLIKEIEEAIEQGVILNKKFNKVINFIKTKAKSIYDDTKDKKKVVHFDIQKVSKYQDLMVSIKHCLLKYEIEIADVYNEILKSSDHNNLLVNNFISEYRMNLITDLKTLKGLNNSYVFLKNFKAAIMSITRSLRSDLKKLKKEVIELELREQTILNNIE